MNMDGFRSMWSLGALVPAVWMLACSTVPDEDAVFAARREQLGALAASQCEAASDCACELTAAQGGCTSQLEDTWLARLRAGGDLGLAWDAACVETIAAQLEDAGCSWPAAGTANPCRDFCQVFHGDRAEGESCDGHDALVSSCAQGLLCDAGRCVAPCAALSGLPEGARCFDTDAGTSLDRCAEGLRCLFPAGRCAQAPAAGSPCLEGQCEDDSYCDWNTDVCRSLPGLGENCDYAQCREGLACAWNEVDFTSRCVMAAGEGESCSNTSCVQGLSCSGATQTCRAPGGEGDPCDVGCREGLACNYDSNVCEPPPPVGAPCPSGECAVGAWCDFSVVFDGVCRPGAALGEACMGHRECASGYCPAGYCDRLPELGESCRETLACGVGTSCDGDVCRPSVTRGPAVCVYEGW